MDCPNCNESMELEEYETFFRNNDKQFELVEKFWCPNCDKSVKHMILYAQEKEWTE